MAKGRVCGFEDEERVPRKMSAMGTSATLFSEPNVLVHAGRGQRGM
jgi:hypothetical protein